ncbi:MAG: hypothetical protein JWO36_2754 [Myxococcales bacterium]|nr:hypothetical protein [Myxococcales bacterium]
MAMYDYYVETETLDFILETEPVASPTHVRPRLLAFLRRWSAEQAPALLDQARMLDLELVVVTDRGVWTFSPDADQGIQSDRIAVDLATAGMLYGVRDGRDAVFLIDEDRVIRFGDRTLETVLTGLSAHGDASTRGGEAPDCRGRGALGEPAAGHGV